MDDIVDTASLPWIPLGPGESFKPLRVLPDDRGRALLLHLEPAWLCRATGISAKCTSSMSSANVNSTRATSWDPALRTSRKSSILLNGPFFWRAVLFAPRASKAAARAQRPL
jgi:hypothetical protein